MKPLKVIVIWIWESRREDVAMNRCSISVGLAPDLVELSEREVFVIHPTFVSKSIFSAAVVISLI